MLILKQTLTSDSNMKQWYIHVCVSVCIYFTIHSFYYFLAGCLFLSALKVIHLMLRAMILSPKNMNLLTAAN